jgi:hypothetical protein
VYTFGAVFAYPAAGMETSKRIWAITALTENPNPRLALTSLFFVDDIFS